MGYIILGIVVLAFVIIVSNITVVQQSKAYVIERLGAFQSVWGVGLHFKVPFIDRVARRVSMKEHTSPIRRYPDTMVHRLLTKYADGGRSANEKHYEELCEHCSEMEQIAQNAERDSIKYKMVEFMGDKLGGAAYFHGGFNLSNT